MQSYEVINVFIFIGVLMCIKSSRAENSSNETFNISKNGTTTLLKTCPQNISFTSANCTKVEKILVCYNGWPKVRNRQYRRVHEVMFCGWTNKTFDPVPILKRLPRIRILKIENSDFISFTNDFPQMKHLEVINITSTKLSYTKQTLFVKVTNLKIVDLRQNALSHIEAPLLFSINSTKLFLSSNPWSCVKNLKWLLSKDKAGYVADRNNMTCTDSKYAGKPVMAIMQLKLNLKQACSSSLELENCSCAIHYIMRGEDERSLIPIISVNCSNANLTRFPTYLPENTTILYATHNQISDVRPLRVIPIYRKVYDIYLDYNKVSSIDVLEAGFWLHKFRVLSLQGNQLTKLPVYALDNALEKNQHASKLYLSKNPWKCTCKFSMKFRDLLMKYESIIKDAGNVTCEYIEDENTVTAKVLLLQRVDVCKLHNDSLLLPLDLLNALLAGLIVFILGKLAYDYYHYRRSGRLPWIVTKLP